MKIGILTFHRCINYGSYWQTRCLVDAVRARGHEPLVLDHASRKVEIAEWRCALRPTVPQAPPPADDRRKYRRKIRRFAAAIGRLPLSRRFRLDAEAPPPQCDAVIVGSDEVWNLSHPWYGGCALFYGRGLHAPRRLAYAASVGCYDVRRGLDPERAAQLRGFDAISVRDAPSRALVEGATGRAPELVVDPCLLGDGGEPPSAAQSASPPSSTPYVLLYGHDFSPAFRAALRRWADARRRAIVSVGYRNPGADEQRLSAGPHEFARLVAGADAVATNFFHGCVFALRAGKPFACEGSPYRSAKLRGLMDTVGGQAHLLPREVPAAGFARLLDEPPHPRIGRRIAALRERSQRYLDRALAA